MRLNKAIQVICFFIFFLLLIGASVPLQAQQRIRVAVLDFTSTKTYEPYASSIRDKIEVSLYRAGNLDLLERNRIELAMKEKNIRPSACADEECMAKLGSILTATYVITGNITCAESCAVTVRIVEVASGRIVYADTQTITKAETADGASAQISRRLASFFSGIKPAAPASEARHRCVIPLMIGYARPTGDLRKIAGQGWSVTTGFFITNLFTENIYAGLNIQYLQFAGSGDVDKIHITPIMAAVGYNFHLIQTLILAPELSSGIAYLRIKDDNSPGGGIENTTAFSLRLRYDRPSVSFVIQPYIQLIAEKSGIIDWVGISVGLIKRVRE